MSADVGIGDVAVGPDADALAIRWADGMQAQFAVQWLRDHLLSDRDPHSGQRLVDVADLPERPRIRAARHEQGRLWLEWEGVDPPSAFDGAWLRSRAAHAQMHEGGRIRLWLEGARNDARRDFAWIDYAALHGDVLARASWLDRLLRDGLAFVRNVDLREEAIFEAVAPIGRMVDTNYGVVFDVRTVVQPENLAYSDLGLGLHTDNPYREPVPGFQALHVIAAAADGGDSLFADGFALAQQLREEAPSDFSVLASTPVEFRFRSADAELSARRPLIALDCEGQLQTVHYNNRSIEPLPLEPVRCRAFYAAYRRLARMLREPSRALHIHMEEGEMVVFDNHRVLHGRTAFASARQLRHLRGCYLARDSVHSAAALARRRAEAPA